MARNQRMTKTIESLDEADRALAEIAEIDTGLARMGEEMNELIARAKQKTSDAAAPLQARKAALEDALNDFAKVNKKRLFVDGKSVTTAHGAFGFRVSPPSLGMGKGVTLGKVLEKLKELKWRAGIRIKESVNKEALLGWPKERLDRLGCRIVTREIFWIRAGDEEIPDGNEEQE